MIWESSYWKEDLLKLSDKINKVYLSTAYDDDMLVEFEKDIMIVMYSVRKLVEAKKLSANTEQIQLQVKSFRNRKNVTRLNWHRIQELYDLDLTSNESIKASYLYNQIIHSYIFLVSLNEEGIVEGFYFTSDRTRNQKLFYIALRQLDRYINIVGNDNPVEERYEYNKIIEDYINVASTSKRDHGIG
ncbi:hypothetical protein [Paenibacillus amylolyticus]|uniref:Uncharacterized protein n=1 Tax=Paenibacillus amylolyticus TaxID=1451 RepID=A0A100VJZ0_PAEAM|nr:hypothetical protein [Paenibacillus amylolyticus]GAS81161.1 unknown protein [Paenibacillus amylolyticus]